MSFYQACTTFLRGKYQQVSRSPSDSARGRSEPNYPTHALPIHNATVSAIAANTKQDHSRVKKRKTSTRARITAEKLSVIHAVSPTRRERRRTRARARISNVYLDIAGPPARIHALQPMPPPTTACSIVYIRSI